MLFRSTLFAGTVYSFCSISTHFLQAWYTVFAVLVHTFCSLFLMDLLLVHTFCSHHIFKYTSFAVTKMTFLARKILFIVYYRCYFSYYFHYFIFSVHTFCRYLSKISIFQYTLFAGKPLVHTFCSKSFYTVHVKKRYSTQFLQVFFS